MPIDKVAVWRRVVALEGETFTQIRGGTFTFKVEGAYLDLDRTNWKIPRSHMEQALDLVPLLNTVAVRHLFAPSYIYAILMDPRVRLTDW